MAEFDAGRPRITRISSIDPRQLGQVATPTPTAIPCEDCPAAEACKSVGNFRKSCPPSQKHSGANPNDENKCVVGTNLLLFELMQTIKNRPVL
jgi:hypothetical protein